LGKNIRLVNEIEVIAQEKGWTSSQIALAWLLKNEGLVAIPGTKSVKYLLENNDSINVKLTDEDMTRLRNVLNTFPVGGDRYPSSSMSLLDI